MKPLNIINDNNNSKKKKPTSIIIHVGIWQTNE